MVTAVCWKFIFAARANFRKVLALRNGSKIFLGWCKEIAPKPSSKISETSPANPFLWLQLRLLASLVNDFERRWLVCDASKCCGLFYALLHMWAQIAKNTIASHLFSDLFHENVPKSYIVFSQRRNWSLPLPGTKNYEKIISWKKVRIFERKKAKLSVWCLFWDSKNMLDQNNLRVGKIELDRALWRQLYG